MAMVQADEGNKTMPICGSLASKPSEVTMHISTGFMLNKIAFPWQSLASCDGFISFRENLLATEGLLPEEKVVRMPLLLALKFSLAWYDFYHYLFNLYHFQDPHCEILS